MGGLGVTPGDSWSCRRLWDGGPGAVWWEQGQGQTGAQQGWVGNCSKGEWAQHWLPAASPGVGGSAGTLPGSAPRHAGSTEGFWGSGFWGSCGSSRAGGGYGATSEHLALCILLHLHCSVGHCVSQGKKMPRNSTDPSIWFCFTARQKGALCVRAERNSPVPQPPQKLNVNYLPPCAFT